MSQQSSLWPYSEQYTAMKREGHKRPTPTFGAPTLVWHIGVWPKREFDPSDSKLGVSYNVTEIANPANDKDKLKFEKNSSGIYKNAIRKAQSDRRLFIEGISTFLEKLQADTRVASPAESFKWDDYQKNGETFKLLRYDSVGFTMWWKDGGIVTAGNPPGDDAMRVRVHVESHIDHFTYSFFIDATKLWQSSIASPDKIFTVEEARGKGQRREEVFQAIESIRTICETRIGGEFLDKELLPEAEHDISEPSAKKLKQASDFLYDKIWVDFCKAFNFTHQDLATGRGEIFAEFRGLVMSTRQDCPENFRQLASLGNKDFPSFDDKGIEANQVLKAYWPFIRRTTPYADYREFVACGVMGWRALYVTTLGSQDEFDPQDESASRQVEVPSDHLIEPWTAQDLMARKAVGDTNQNEKRQPKPIRYLFLTKCEPHRKQIGRIVERINALGTMRLFALKDIEIMRDASFSIRMYGQYLDEVMTQWSRAKTQVEIFIAKHYPTSDPTLDSKRADEKNDRLTELTSAVEMDLIAINAGLEELGKDAAGGLPYCMYRSKYYIQEFDRLVKLLNPGNINTWVSYDQFVDRGLRPTFDFIENTSERLKSLRNRLQSVTESIQTSAVSIQTAATRYNTSVLTGITVNWKNTNDRLWWLTILAITASVLGAVSSLFGDGWFIAMFADTQTLKPCCSDKP